MHGSFEAHTAAIPSDTEHSFPLPSTRDVGQDTRCQHAGAPEGLLLFPVSVVVSREEEVWVAPCHLRESMSSRAADRQVKFIPGHWKPLKQPHQSQPDQREQLAPTQATSPPLADLARPSKTQLCHLGTEVFSCKLSKEEGR